jgi:pimeloyl-ACP methyl ester carboxylesterase
MPGKISCSPANGIPAGGDVGLQRRFVAFEHRPKIVLGGLLVRVVQPIICVELARPDDRIRECRDTPRRDAADVVGMQVRQQHLVHLLRPISNYNCNLNRSLATHYLVRASPEDRTPLAHDIGSSTLQTSVPDVHFVNSRITGKMARFVLIHGAWHGGWCWERVVPLLLSVGHEVLAPDLPGVGADRTPFAADVLGQWADFVAALVRGAAEPAVLVGHSRGGLVISEAAERAPDQIRAVVYLSALLLPVSMTSRQKLNADGGSVLSKSLRMNQESASMTIDPEAASDLFYNLTSPEDSAAAVARLTPEPFAGSARSLIITSANFGRVRRVYIEAEHDHAIPLAIQREMHSHLPCDRVITLPPDHSPFFSVPDKLAQALLSLA